MVLPKRFTQDELVELGLVEKPNSGPQQGQTPISQDNLSNVAPPVLGQDRGNVTPQPPVGTSPDPATAKLAEALEKLSARLDSPQQTQSSPVEEKSSEELIAEGRLDEAIIQAKKEGQNQLGQILPLVASQAKTLFKQQLGDRFDKWYPHMLETLKRQNVSEHAFVSMEQWNDLYNYTRSQNMNLVEEEIKSDLTSRMSSTLVSSGSRGESSFFSDEAQKTGLTPNEVSIARDFYVAPKQWAQSKKICEKYTDHRGDVTGVPLVNRDIVDRDEFGDIIIKPGQF